MNKKRSNFKILQITKNKFPPEIRVLKEGRSLCNAGYVSAVICPPFGNQPEYEDLEGIKIFRPKVLKNRSFIDKIFEFILFDLLCNIATSATQQQSVKIKKEP